MVKKSLVIVFLVLFFVYGVGADPIPVTECGTLDFPGETYELQNDIVFSGPSSMCFVVNSFDVTLDGVGHTITSDSSDSLTIGVIATNLYDIEIRNLNIKDFDIGIKLVNTDSSNIDNNDIEANTQGISIIDSNNNVLSNNKISDSVYGISIETSGAIQINDNFVCDNTIDFFCSSSLELTGIGNSFDNLNECDGWPTSPMNYVPCEAGCVDSFECDDDDSNTIDKCIRGVCENIVINCDKTHSADIDGDYKIEGDPDLELSYVIELYYADEYHCDDSEDGYAPGSGDQSCTSHDSDYNPADWDITLSEFLRTLEIAGQGGYFYCHEVGEDDFCLGYYQEVVDACIEEPPISQASCALFDELTCQSDHTTDENYQELILAIQEFPA